MTMANGERKNGGNGGNRKNGRASNGASTDAATNGERRDPTRERVNGVLATVRTRDSIDVSEEFKGDVRDEYRKRGRGRPSVYDKNPEKIIEEAEKFAILGLPQSDMAWWWGVCPDTVSGWKERHPEFSDVLKRGDVGRKISLLGAMHHNAIVAKIPSVQIFLAKNVLGYKDFIEVPVNADPMRITIVRAAKDEKK